MKKESDEKNLKALKSSLFQRAERCICRQCGGKIVPSIVILDQYGGQEMDLYCPQCERVDFGIEPEIYDMAKVFIERFEYNYYVDMEEGERLTKLNTGKIVEMLSWFLKNLGLVDQDGIKYCLPNFENFKI